MPRPTGARLAQMAIVMTPLLTLKLVGTLVPVNAQAMFLSVLQVSGEGSACEDPFGWGLWPVWLSVAA